MESSNSLTPAHRKERDERATASTLSVGIFTALDRATCLQHANGVYSDPDWSGAPDDPSGDWRAFIEATIERGRKDRELAQAAPHNENAVAD